MGGRPFRGCRSLAIDGSNKITPSLLRPRARVRRGGGSATRWPDTWVPPNLGALVRAARRTTMRRWAPGTGHECFALVADLRWNTEWSPAFVARTRSQGYAVHAAPLQDYTDELLPTLITKSASAAAAELELLLAHWAPPTASQPVATPGERAIHHESHEQDPHPSRPVL
ncbi:hypothetical protein ACTIVE_5343 [Actinomadura verrucosospora]|uniref:Uncharacterized protein n=1 Tax=Actinomadura verrucosospora TaxID=46165 RepID=A0A7D3VUT9_ACTVE|nr:hypothetical protein ACTIVE_5343 [Actinomadura verrucosospora]